MRAALGASRGALRRTLLAESLVLCGAGAVLGVLLARPLVAVVARFAARFSVRALEVTVDASLLWVGAGLAIAAAVLLAYVPRLPSSGTRPAGLGARRAAASASRRAPTAACARSRRRRSRSRSCCSPAPACCSPRSSPLQTANTGYNMRQVLAHRRADAVARRRRRRRRCALLPGGDAAHRRAAGRRRRRARQLRAVARRRQLRRRLPVHRRGLHAGRRRGEPARAACASSRPASSRCSASRCSPAATSPTTIARGSEPVVIVSQSVAQRLFPNGDALNRQLWWTDPLLRQARAAPHRRRRRRRGRRERRARAGADGLSPGSADAVSPAGCSCTRRAIRTRSCRR